MLLKAIEIVLRDNYMIHYPYPNNFTGLNESLSNTEIFCTGRCITARVIVCEYDGSSGGPHCSAEDLSRMNKAGRQRALGNPRLREDSISAIEEEHHKIFLASESYALTKVVENISGAIDSISPLKRASYQSSSHLYGRDQRSRLCGADPRETD
jgi:hypothetical protein